MKCSFHATLRWHTKADSALKYTKRSFVFLPHPRWMSSETGGQAPAHEAPLEIPRAPKNVHSRPDVSRVAE